MILVNKFLYCLNSFLYAGSILALRNRMFLCRIDLRILAVNHGFFFSTLFYSYIWKRFIVNSFKLFNEIIKC